MSSSQLTRFTQQHARDETAEGPAPHPAANQRPVEEAPAPLLKRIVPKVTPSLPKTTVVQAPEKQIVRSTAADLYSDAPITISVLKRALPQRFAKVEADNTLAFANPQKNSNQMGLTHAIRPLKSLFPHDPS